MKIGSLNATKVSDWIIVQDRMEPESDDLAVKKQKKQKTDLSWPHLIAMNHEVVCGDQGFEDHHPAGVSGSLYQNVGHLRDVHIGFLGGLN